MAPRGFQNKERSCGCWGVSAKKVELAPGSAPPGRLRVRGLAVDLSLSGLQSITARHVKPLLILSGAEGVAAGLSRPPSEANAGPAPRLTLTPQSPSPAPEGV